jgi:hypothetical protein
MVRENDAECSIAESAAEMATFLTEHDSIYAEIQTLSGVGLR